MKTANLSLSLLATLTTILATASPLPSTCNCGTALPNPLFFSQLRPVNCEYLCEFVSGSLALNLEETEVHLKLEDLGNPIEGAERPLPTSVLMQLSSRSENKPSAPSQTATPTLYYQNPSGQGGRHKGLIEGFEQRHLLVILLGLLALVLVAVVTVEVEELWKRRSCAILPRPGEIMLANDLVTPYQHWDGVFDEKIYSRPRLASI